MTIDIWSNRQMRSSLASLFVSFQVKSYTIIGLLQTIQRSSDHTAENIISHSLTNSSVILKLLAHNFSAMVDECSSLIQLMSF